eukprot:SAG25_NODE_4405_length_824_cov_1.560000_1_plen_38_part_10
MLWVQRQQNAARRIQASNSAGPMESEPLILTSLPVAIT